MALSVSLQQSAILAELNQLSNDTLKAVLALYWDMNGDKGSGRLQYLYTKRDCVDYLLGQSWDDVDVGTGAVTGKVSMDQRSTHLQRIRDNVDAEIKRLNNNLRVSVPTAAASPFIGTPQGEFG